MPFLIIAFLLLLTTAQGQEINYKNWKTKTDIQFFSTLKYPPEWKEGVESSDGYSIISPVEDKDDKFLERVALSVIHAPDGVELEDVKGYAEELYLTQKSNLKNTTLLQNTYIQIQGYKMYMVVYTGVSNGMNYYFIQLNCLHKNVAYSLLFMAEAAKKDKYKKIASYILSSFKPLK